MKNLFIIGSQGYNKNYGGWETFVKNFCDNYDKKDTQIYVSEISYDDEGEYQSNNIICNKIKVLKIGSVTMMWYSIKALMFYIKYIKKNHIDNAIIYILGLRQGNLLFFLRHKLKKLHIKVFVNPDGLEWKRSKWNKLIKMYFKFTEKSMTKNCDGIICDAVGIKDYLEKTYPKNHVPKYYIAYGANVLNLDNVNELEILSKYHLQKDNYCLIVSRCVPENNLELMIKEFMKSQINKELVIISNIEGNHYFDTIKANTQFESDKRIHVIGSLYNHLDLSVIRHNAYLYLHGHSVGGTNPSLLEAMSLTDLNLLYNCCFNMEVGFDTCLYFSDAENSLSDLLNNHELLEKSKKELGTKAKKRIQKEFTWKIIVRKYRDVFKKNC